MLGMLSAENQLVMMRQRAHLPGFGGVEHTADM